MSSLRNVCLPVLDLVRGMLDTTFDMRVDTLTIRTRTWSGTKPGAGTATDVDLPIIPNPFSKQLTEKEISGSGGRFLDGDIRVGPITPEYPIGAPTGGYNPSQLAPKPVAKNVEIIYVIGGPGAGEYSLVSPNDTGRNFSYFLVLRRRRSTP